MSFPFFQLPRLNRVCITCWMVATRVAQQRKKAREAEAAAKKTEEPPPPVNNSIIPGVERPPQPLQSLADQLSQNERAQEDPDPPIRNPALAQLVQNPTATAQPQAPQPNEDDSAWSSQAQPEDSTQDGTEWSQNQAGASQDPAEWSSRGPNQEQSQDGIEWTARINGTMSNNCEWLPEATGDELSQQRPDWPAEAQTEQAPETEPMQVEQPAYQSTEPIQEQNAEPAQNQVAAQPVPAQPAQPAQPARPAAAQLVQAPSLLQATHQLMTHATNPKIQSMLYTRLSATSRYCLVRRCRNTALLPVPNGIRDVLLIENKVYVPHNAMVCQRHLYVDDWRKLKGRLNDFTPFQVDDIFKRLQKYRHHTIDFERVERMDPHWRFYYLGLTVEQFNKFIREIPELSHQLRRPRRALSIFLVDLRKRCASMQQMAALFSMPREAMERDLRAVKYIMASIDSALWHSLFPPNLRVRPH